MVLKLDNKQERTEVEVKDQALVSQTEQAEVGERL
jgi:hypothetical protein